MPKMILLNHLNAILISKIIIPVSQNLNTHLFNESVEEGRYNKAALQALPQQMRVNTQNHGERR
jgi:hypothetical protein